MNEYMLQMLADARMADLRRTADAQRRATAIRDGGESRVPWASAGVRWRRRASRLAASELTAAR